MPKISIIIPVYNAENYIERCLDSVCNQTLKDIEVICVNDCSKDNSLQILQDYSKKYPNLKIIDCEINRGESAARNRGVEAAEGEYLAFVDNDDTIDLDFCEKLFNKAIETDADIVKGSAKITDYDGKVHIETLNKNIREHNSKFYFAYYWWTAIYRRNLIEKNNIRFLENYPLGGDVLFLNEAIIKSNRLELVDNIHYNYYRREDSGDSLHLNFDKIQSVLEIHERIVDNIISNNIYKEDPEGARFVCSWSFCCALNYAYRNKTISTLKYCIDKAFSIYNKTNGNFGKIEVYQIVLDYFAKNDKEGLINLYLENDTSQKLFLANLRFMHNKTRGKA